MDHESAEGPFVRRTNAARRKKRINKVKRRKAISVAETDETMKFLNDNSRRKREATEQARREREERVRRRFEKGPVHALLNHFRYTSPEEIRKMEKSIEEQIDRIKREEGIADESDIAEDEFTIDCDELIRSGDVFVNTCNNIGNEE